MKAWKEEPVLTTVTLWVTIMIKSFRHKGLEDFFNEDTLRGIQPKHAKKLSHILNWLDRAKSIEDMDIPGYTLHPLKGDLEGLWAVKVSGNWRVVFMFEKSNAYMVNYLDYH